MKNSLKNSSLNGKSILVTGGTGSFGQHFVQRILSLYKPKRLIIFSRDELKQFQMSLKFSSEKFNCIRYFIGDIRDRKRINRACVGVDLIIHAAAMKHISAAEYNPTECIATNIYGAENLIDAALEENVERVVALSTDKAANPINLYGATKLASDKLFIAANNISGKKRTRFSVVRYGNVAGSRGSVIPHFKRLIDSGIQKLPITDINMTRFIITLDQGVNFVIKSLLDSYGGEIIIPKLPSIKITDLIDTMLYKGAYKVVGIRPGEKLHEVMIPYEESRNAVDMGNYYVIQPTHHWWNIENFKRHTKGHGKIISEPFEYNSEKNKWWLKKSELLSIVKSCLNK